MLYLKNLSIVKGAVWDKNEKIYFCEGGGSSSHVTLNGANMHSVQGIRIDSTPACKDCTFIKMDIEGSEKMALLGAKNHIINEHPKLAISVYHNNEDIWEIGKLIYEMDNSYQFFMRYYGGSIYPSEYVLYAI